jgi:hypothetical protein
MSGTSTRRTALAAALLLGVGLLALAPAAPAATFVDVDPTISGSGTITTSADNRVCVAVDRPNGATTACGLSLVPVGIPPTTITVTATPQSLPAGHWTFVRWSGGPCDTSASPVCTVTGNGNAMTAIFEDHTGPTITSPTVTYSTVEDRKATVSWAANEPLGGTTCAVDDGAAAVCGPEREAFTLPEGSHTVVVRGTDRSGNVGSATVPVRIVDTTIVGAPAAVSNVTSPTFAFTSVLGTSFECRVDAGAYAPCGTKGLDGRASAVVGPLADGTHALGVRAKDGGDQDPVPATFTWRIDTVAPKVTLDPDTGPREGALRTATRETFAFSADEAGSTFECRLDAARFAPCASGVVVRGLKPRAHRFEVRPVDPAGNVGAAVARRWTVASPRIAGTVGVSATAGRRSTRITRLVVKGVPAAATVRLVCAGGGCPKALKGKGRTTKKTKKPGTVTLTELVRPALRPGATLTITLAKTGATSTVTVVTVRTGTRPSVTTRCRPSGATKPTAC